MTRKMIIAIVTGFAVLLAVIWTSLYVVLGQGIIPFSPHDEVAGPIILYIAGAFLAVLLTTLVGIGVFVYRDARQRGMPAILWTLVAIFVPYFVGLVVYLIARQARTARCPNCGWAAPADAAFCPRCGQALQSRCAGCRGRVPNDAKFCPGCGVAVGTP